MSKKFAKGDRVRYIGTGYGFAGGFVSRAGKVVDTTDLFIHVLHDTSSDHSSLRAHHPEDLDHETVEDMLARVACEAARSQAK